MRLCQSSNPEGYGLNNPEPNCNKILQSMKCVHMCWDVWLATVIHDLLPLWLRDMWVNIASKKCILPWAIAIRQTFPISPQLCLLPATRDIAWWTYYVDGYVQERRNSSVLALELCLSCTNPSMYRSMEMWSCEAFIIFSVSNIVFIHALAAL